MSVSAIILSGGRATRMGGIDKGLVPLHNKPLIAHVIDRIQPQVDEVFINANRELALYQAFGLSVLTDEHQDFIGPLAGFYIGLKHSKHAYLLTVPCDSPNLPQHLVAQLLDALTAQHADIAVATSDGHAHPVVSLCKTTVLPSLATFIAKGERKVSLWQKQQAYVEVDFSNQPDAFINLNTHRDVQWLEQHHVA